MTVYECRCGFSSGTAVGFQRHIARYKGETGKHRMVKRPSPPQVPAQTGKTTDTLAVEPSRPSERSWLSGLWAPDGGSATPSAADTLSTTPEPPPARTSQASPGKRLAAVQSSDKLEVASSGGDSAWEKISTFADSGEDIPSSKDEYAALTAQLAASGPAAGTRARSRRPTSDAATSKLASRKSRQPSEGSDTAKTALDSDSPAHSSANQATAAGLVSAASPKSPDAEPLNPSSTSPQKESESLVVSVPAPPADPAAQPVDIHKSALDHSHRAAASSATTTHAEETNPSDVPGSEPSTSPPHAAAVSRPPTTLSPQQDALHRHGNELVRKSVGVMNWLKASTDAALTLQPASAQSIHALENKNACSADDVEAVLLWQEPMKSSKVFLGGMYILICLRQLVLGVELLQPSTAVAGVLLALLLGSSVRVALLPSARAPTREVALQAQINQAASRTGAQAAAILGAVGVLMYRRLSGHDRTGTTVWLALTLWSVMALGEAALLAQSSVWLAVWCAIFGLPTLYLHCRHILDLLVEEALQLMAVFLKAGQRGTVLFAGGAGLVVLVAVPLSLFARLSLAVLTVGNILFWKACMPATKGRSLHRAKQ